MRTVLFTCVFNATRSIMAEALLNHLGADRYRAFSAGEHASGSVHPLTLECLSTHGIPTVGLYTKTWVRHARLGGPPIDLLITLCSESREDMSQQGRPAPIRAHWDTANPAAVRGTDEEMRRAFEYTFELLRRRIEVFLRLPLDNLDRLAQGREVTRIGRLH